MDRERTRIYESASEAEAARAFAYFQYVVCVLIFDDKAMTTSDKLKAWEQARGGQRRGSLRNFNFSIQPSPMIGGLEMLVSNPIDEAIAITDSKFMYPTAGFKYFSPQVRAQAEFMNFIMNFQASPGQGDPRNLPPRHTSRLFGGVYGCDPLGRQTWALMLAILKAGVNGLPPDCRLCISVKSLSNDSYQRCQSMNCSRLGVVSDLPSLCSRS